MYVCMYVCMHACMNVCTYIHDINIAPAESPWVQKLKSEHINKKFKHSYAYFKTMWKICTSGKSLGCGDVKRKRIPGASADTYLV